MGSFMEVKIVFINGALLTYHAVYYNSDEFFVSLTKTNGDSIEFEADTVKYVDVKMSSQIMVRK